MQSIGVLRPNFHALTGELKICLSETPKRVGELNPAFVIPLPKRRARSMKRHIAIRRTD